MRTPPSHRQLVAFCLLIAGLNCGPYHAPDYGLERSAIFNQYAMNEQQMKSGSSLGDTLSVIAYAIEPVPNAEQNTIMKLARPSYSPGAPASGVTTRAGVPTGSPSLAASIGYEKSHYRFVVNAPLHFFTGSVVRTMVPLVFHARKTGETIRLKDGETVDVLDVLSLVTPPGITTDSTYQCLACVPRHLSNVVVPVALSVNWYHKLDKYEASVPSDLDAGVDWEMTEDLYKQAAKHFRDKDPQKATEYSRVATWSKSALLAEKAMQSLHASNPTKAIKLLNEAVQNDGEYERLYLLLYDTNRLIGHFDDADATLRQAAAHHALEPALEKTLRDGLHDAKFHASPEFGAHPSKN